jgi:uncharacterized membrane protein YdjX (TVP38/TMEM64 family)
VVSVVGDERAELALAASAPAPPPVAAWMRPRTRLALVGAVLVLGFVVVRTSGLGSSLSAENLRLLLVDAGVSGVLLFVVIYSVGLLAQLPSLLFITVAVLVYGQTLGTLVALLGSIVAACVTFVVVRRFGGHALAEVESPLMRRMLAQLETRPLRSVIVLRAVFGVAPLLNYALALSSLGFRDYLIGSAIGMTPPIAVAAAILHAAL